MALGVLTIGAAFLVGGMTGRRDLQPWPQFSALKNQIVGTQDPPDSRYRFDPLGRLIADETKTPVDCPRQTPRTLVLLVLGQSNAANHAGSRYRSDHGDQVVNFFEGRCYAAVSPLLGATDTKGEYWTALGNLMIASGQFDDVVIAPLAIDGSAVARWAQGGDLNELLIETLAFLDGAGYRPTEVLWHQGERDYVDGTIEDAYRDRFLSMVDTLREHNVDAPVYVSIASKCLEPSNGGFKTHHADNPVVRAQRALPEGGRGILQGVDTDALLDPLDRHDDCHIGGTGAAKVAAAWANRLLAEGQIVDEGDSVQ